MDLLDAYRCAKLLLDRHGQDADARALMRANELAAVGDQAGFKAFEMIRAAIDQLQRTGLRGNERLH